MHKARAFFFVCAGLFLLVLSYHLGAQSAGAQAPGNPVVAAMSGPTGAYVCTANGDVYYQLGTNSNVSWGRAGNIFGGGPTPTVSQPTWGQLKAKYAAPSGGAEKATSKP